MENKLPKKPKSEAYEDIDLKSRNYYLPPKKKILDLDSNQDLRSGETPEASATPTPRAPEELIDIQILDTSAGQSPEMPSAPPVSPTVILPISDTPERGGTQILWGDSPAADPSLTGSPRGLTPESDPDLEATNYYLPPRRDREKTPTAFEFGPTPNLAQPPTVALPRTQFLPAEPLPPLSRADQRDSDVLFGRNTPPSLEESLPPSLNLALDEEMSTPADSAQGGRKRLLSVVGYGVFTLLILGGLGWLALTFWKESSPIRAASGAPAQKQVVETVRGQLRPAQTDIPRVNTPATSELKQNAPVAGKTLEEAAADALAAGRTDQALSLYRELVRLHPDQPAYSAIVDLLNQRAKKH